MDLNKNNAKLEIKNNKFKIVNVSRLKSFCEPSDNNVCQEDPSLSQGDPSLFQDKNINSPQRPITRALKKLIDYKNAATMAIQCCIKIMIFSLIHILSQKITLNFAVINAITPFSA